MTTLQGTRAVEAGGDDHMAHEEAERLPTINWNEVQCKLSLSFRRKMKSLGSVHYVSISVPNEAHSLRLSLPPVIEIVR
jgi:hypothetical protein